MIRFCIYVNRIYCPFWKVIIGLRKWFNADMLQVYSWTIIDYLFQVFLTLLLLTIFFIILRKPSKWWNRPTLKYTINVSRRLVFFLRFFAEICCLFRGGGGLFHMWLDRYARPTRIVSGCQRSVKMGLLLSEVRKEGYQIVKNDRKFK